MTAVDLQWYSDLKAHLSKHMIPVDDVAKFAKTVDGIKQYGYDVNNVVNEFSNLEILELKQNNLQGERAILRNQTCKPWTRMFLAGPRVEPPIMKQFQSINS